jgi:hypothetical protein
MTCLHQHEGSVSFPFRCSADVTVLLRTMQAWVLYAFLSLAFVEGVTHTEYSGICSTVVDFELASGANTSALDISVEERYNTFSRWVTKVHEWETDLLDVARLQCFFAGVVGCYLLYVQCLHATLSPSRRGASLPCSNSRAWKPTGPTRPI